MAKEGRASQRVAAGGVSASRTTKHRLLQDLGFLCHNPCVKPILNKSQKHLACTKYKKDWIADECFLMKIHFAFPMESKVP